MDDKHRHMEDKIRKSFEEVNQSAPDLWSNISESLDGINEPDALSGAVKEAFEGTTHVAPEKAWSAINRQLNIDLVWERISGLLDKRPWYFNWKWQVSGLAVVLLGTWLLFGSDNEAIYTPRLNDGTASGQSMLALNNVDLVTPDVSDAADNVSHQQTETDIPETHQEHIANPFIASVIPGSEGGGLPTKHQGNTPSSPGENEPVASGTVENEGRVGAFTTREVLAELNTLPAYPIVTVNKPKEIHSKTAPMEDNLPEIPSRNWSAGLYGGYNLTQVWNNATRISYDPNSLISSSNVYTFTYGIAGHYAFNAKNRIVSRLIVKDMVSQEYGIYEKGKYSDQQLQLRYNSLSLLYGRKWLLKRDKSNGIITGAGVYGSYLNQGLRSDAESNDDITADYTVFDYGTEAFVSYEFQWHRFELEAGLDARVGVQNVFDGTTSIPEDFDRTNTIRAGAFTALRFRF